MYELELFVFILSAFATFLFLKKWYKYLHDAWPHDRLGRGKWVLGLLPAAAFFIILYTLRALAAFDVVDSFLYTLLYLFLGYAWLYASMVLVNMFLDLSWQDDAIHLNNKAALAVVCGAFLGATLIYCGANIGDGPGWWCVVFAGGLGLTAWLVLGVVANGTSGVLERVTVGRDMGCGLRLGFYLLASGIILARASAGDWTSFSMTVVEFLDGWPVLLLLALMILVERCYMHEAKKKEPGPYQTATSLLWGLLYVAVAVVSVMLLPELNENPIYRRMATFY